ncbi:MAG: M23 family metallopeptidase [Candidatus Omnitrophota bacterium]|nr:M23 family metallopeptidase [Candidatus Omnitrophota bacterium]
MKRDFIIVAAIITITIAATILLYDPVSLLIFNIREPFFIRPVHTSPSKMVVRNDAHGDGEFGSKRRNGRSHSGIDILAPTGTPVYAAKSGTAFKAEVPTGYGKYVMIYHPGGYQTYYGHLADWAIKPVQRVNKGDLIGYVGKTGNAASKSMQPHLHFEIRKEGEPQDPRRLMR